MDISRDYRILSLQSHSTEKEVLANGIGLRVLVADSDTGNAESIAVQLRQSGHQVRVVRDGPSALRAAQSASPDVVLLQSDLRGQGRAVASQLQEQAAEKPPFLIALTDPGAAAEVPCPEESGIDLCLAKPVDFHFLQNLLRRFQGVVRSEEPACAGDCA